jgi:predicted DNA repair protein MutK
MLGGAYLCFEGVEKLAHRWFHDGAEDAEHDAELMRALSDPAVDLRTIEKGKIKGAVRTDFVLSAEIIVITLGTVANSPFVNRMLVLVGIAALMTVGVYGIVAAVVKLDDLGLYLSRRGGESAQARVWRGVGHAILAGAPWLMKGLSVAGTAAMFLVGGGILVHGIPPLHHAFDHLAERLAALPTVGHTLRLLSIAAFHAATGIVVGALVLGIVTAVQRAVRARAPESAATSPPSGSHS